MRVLKTRAVSGRILAAIALTIVLAGVFGSHVASAHPDQQGDLLVNGGFEPFTTPEGKFDYPIISTPDGGGHVAEGWGAWWYNDEGVEYSVPEFDIAPIYRDPFRVRSGNASQQIFRPSVFWKAGVYQTVNVPANASLHFQAFAQVWSSFCVHKVNSDGSEF